MLRAPLPGRRSWPVVIGLAGALIAGPGTASAALPSSFVWGTSFSSGSETAGFSSYYASHGQCAVSMAGGAALYTWKASASDGQSTRCYPVVEWNDHLAGFRATGRFWVDLDRSQLTSGRTFSLSTFKLAKSDWARPLTLNLKVASSGATSGKTSLFLFHTPNHGSGTQTVVREAEFPLRTWVTVSLTMTAAGDIEVYQSGQLVLKARKTDAGAQLFGAHWGGYANSKLTRWTMGNDNLDLRNLAAPAPATPGDTPAAPPAAAAPPAPAPSPITRPGSAPQIPVRRPPAP